MQPRPEHYASVFIDPATGKLRVQVSPSIQELDNRFPREMQQRFMEILGPRVGHVVPGHSGTESRRRGDSYPVKRRKISNSSCPNSFPYSVQQLEELEIGDTQKVTTYYENSFKHFQQLNCRNIAKVFIRAIEPRKQVKYPYNGGRMRNPDLTKPPWWPVGVIHKEPDHLKMEGKLLSHRICLFRSPSGQNKLIVYLDRIPLLIHILRNLGEYGITSDRLRSIADPYKHTLQEGGIEILDQVLDVRKLEEQYERNELGASTKFYVFNYNSGEPRHRNASRPINYAEDTLGLLRPPSSMVQFSRQPKQDLRNQTPASHYSQDDQATFTPGVGISSLPNYGPVNFRMGPFSLPAIPPGAALQAHPLSTPFYPGLSHSNMHVMEQPLYT